MTLLCPVRPSTAPLLRRCGRVAVAAKKFFATDKICFTVGSVNAHCKKKTHLAATFFPSHVDFASPDARRIRPSTSASVFTASPRGGVRRFLATWALRRLLSPDSSRRRRRWAARVTRFETRRLASHRLRESGTGSPWTAELAGAPATGSRRAGASARAPRLSGWRAARAWRPPSRWAASVRQIAGPRTRASVTLGSRARAGSPRRRAGRSTPSPSFTGSARALTPMERRGSRGKVAGTSAASATEACAPELSSVSSGHFSLALGRRLGKVTKDFSPPLVAAR